MKPALAQPALLSHTETNQESGQCRASVVPFVPHCLIGGTLCPAVTAPEQLRLVGVLPVTQVSYSKTEADVWDPALATSFALRAFTVSGRATTTRINRELHFLAAESAFLGCGFDVVCSVCPTGKLKSPPLPSHPLPRGL